MTIVHKTIKETFSIETIRGLLPKSYRVSSYRQDIHIELSHRVISLALKTDCRQPF